jgi:hypothetical protein
MTAYSNHHLNTKEYIMNNVLWVSTNKCTKEQESELQIKLGDHLVIELSDEAKKELNNVAEDIDMFDIGNVFWRVFNSAHTGNLSDFEAMVIEGDLSLCIAATQFAVMENVSVYTPVRRDGKHVQLRCLHYTY